MANEELRAKVIASAKNKICNCNDLAPLESLALTEYIEELESAQQRANLCPECQVERQILLRCPKCQSLDAP